MVENAIRRNSGCRIPKGCQARGFTLVEVMIAMVVLALGMLASVIGIMTALDHGMLNQMRSEAVKIAQEQAEAITNAPYTNISSLNGQQIATTVVRQVRNAQITYTVTPTYTRVMGSGGATMSEVTIEVSWNGREGNQTEPFHYTLQTIVGPNL